MGHPRRRRKGDTVVPPYRTKLGNRASSPALTLVDDAWKVLSQPAETSGAAEKLAIPSNPLPHRLLAWACSCIGCSAANFHNARRFLKGRRCRARKPRGAGSREPEPGLAGGKCVFLGEVPQA